jgi:hypothetical protein
MPRSYTKGQGSGAAIAVIAVIIVAVVVLFAFPGITGGGFNFFGGGTAAPIGLGSGTAGVVITSFAANPPVSDGGNEVTFELNLENKGGWDAESIKYDIFGIGDSLSWSGKTEDSGETELIAANPSRNLQGGTTYHAWTSTPKEKNTDVVYTVTARVDYEYETDTNLEMQLYGRKDPDVARLGISQSKVNSITTTSGPMAVAVAGTLPLLTGSSDKFSITFEITNVGGGRPYVGSIASGLDKVKISAQGCDITSDNTEPRLTNNRRTVRCEVSPSIAEDKQDVKTVQFNLEYNYLIEKPTTVSVRKSDDIVN